MRLTALLGVEVDHFDRGHRNFVGHAVGHLFRELLDGLSDHDCAFARLLYEPREARTVRVGCVGVLVEDLLHVASTPSAVSMELDELT
jgi:hypothetical protein